MGIKSRFDLRRDQKVVVRVPRGRDRGTNAEELSSYQRLQSAALLEQLALKRVINGVSMRKYEEAALAVPVKDE